jgi:hypothetical protein
MISKLLITLFFIASVSFVSAKESAPEETKTEVFTPESLLPDGVDSTISINPYTGESGPARKGTVAATLNNIALLNTKITSNKDEKEIQALIDTIKGIIPSLRVIGVFDLFTPEEWISSDNQPGRVLVAVLYLQQYPKEINPVIRQKLEKISSTTKFKILSQEIKKL